MSPGPENLCNQDQPQQVVSSILILSPEQGKPVDVRRTLPMVDVTFSVALRILESEDANRLALNAPFVVGCRKEGNVQPGDEPPNDSTIYNLSRGIMTLEMQTAKVLAKCPGGENVVIVWVKKANGRWSVSQEVGFVTNVIP